MLHQLVPILQRFAPDSTCNCSVERTGGLIRTDHGRTVCSYWMMPFACSLRPESRAHRWTDRLLHEECSEGIGWTSNSYVRLPPEAHRWHLILTSATSNLPSLVRDATSFRACRRSILRTDARSALCLFAPIIFPCLDCPK
jgi:hypothetical protein